jgi:hypothetical protein
MFSRELATDERFVNALERAYERMAAITSASSLADTLQKA